MTAEDPRPPDASSREWPPLDLSDSNSSPFLYFILGVLAVGSPYAAIPFFGVYRATLGAVLICFLWLRVLQTMKANVVRICAWVAILVVVNAMVLVLASVVKLAMHLISARVLESAG